MRRVCCLFACLLPVIILFSYSMRVCVCFFFSYFASPSCTTDQGLITVSKSPVSIPFSRECRHMMDQGDFICTEVMLFINSTFQWKLSVMKGRMRKRNQKKITFVLSFTPKLVEHSLWHRGKKNDLIVFIHRFVTTNHLLFFSMTIDRSLESRNLTLHINTTFNFTLKMFKISRFYNYLKQDIPFNLLTNTHKNGLDKMFQNSPSLLVSFLVSAIFI